ncbi:hypothetical protein CO251_10460 [Sulfobacillus sp. hq2]|nr:hypothetical protein CO251_10460 [Sulfobacillus sp. hq2]
MKGLRQRHGAGTIRLLERSQVAKEFMDRRARQDAPRWREGHPENLASGRGIGCEYLGSTILIWPSNIVQSGEVDSLGERTKVW